MKYVLVYNDRHRNADRCYPFESQSYIYDIMREILILAGESIVLTQARDVHSAWNSTFFYAGRSFNSADFVQPNSLLAMKYRVYTLDNWFNEYGFVQQW